MKKYQVIAAFEQELAAVLNKYEKASMPDGEAQRLIAAADELREKFRSLALDLELARNKIGSLEAELKTAAESGREQARRDSERSTAITKESTNVPV
jgi:hypothetical protein